MTLPSGPAVTFLFTDIEGSTRLERAAGSAAWAAVVARHDELLRAAIERNDGVVVKTEGDAFFAAFVEPVAAAAAAADAQRAVASEAWPATCEVRVRMGLHLGEGRIRGGRADGEAEDYVGIDVNYAARVAAAGNGGQIVASQSFAERLLDALGPTGLRGDVRLDTVELADEGLRALKDFEEPQRLHRLVISGAADDTRPLRTLDAPSNLPADVTELLGREAEIARLQEELGRTRILTLTGPGGSGKTRLAIAVAAGLRDRYPHGTWFVDIAAVPDPAQLESTIAAALGLREASNQSIEATLRDHLRDRVALLVLDNLEQLLPTGATTVAELARNAPTARFLITSRELLRIGGEHGHSVPPLDLAAGTELFVARARDHRPDLGLTDDDHAAIREIAQRLGGLPLAIELAAARIRLLSPALIRDRLATSLDLGGGPRDLPERQRTLRGAIAWSHDLLTDEERRLFRRLGVFAGGWTAATALAVTDPVGDLGLDLLAGLESLADKSLIRIEPAGSDDDAQEARFDFHPLLREFALERLAESGERADLEARHAEACVGIAERAQAGIFGPTGAAVMRLLDREVHNLRAGVEWAQAHERPDVGLRIVGATWRWFHHRGRIREARALLAPLLAQPVEDQRIRIAGLAAEGGLAYWMDDPEGTRAAYTERLELAEATGDPLLRAEAHYDVGYLSLLARDPEGIRRHEGLALELYESLGREDQALRARQALAVGEFQAGDYAHALELELRNFAFLEALGSQLQVADSMTLQSAIRYRLGEPETAWALTLRGLEGFAAGDNASGIVRALAMAAILLLDHGDAELGARVAGTTLELAREKGVMLATVRVLGLPDPGEHVVARLGPERGNQLLDEGADTPLGDVIEAVLAAPAPSSPIDQPVAGGAFGR